VIGFAVMLEGLARAAHNTRVAERIATAALLLLMAWNVGFIYQWGTHLVPARGPISWREMIHNQVAVVPKQMAANLRDYFTRRKSMMQELEQKDIEQRRELKQP